MSMKKAFIFLLSAAVAVMSAISCDPKNEIMIPEPDDNAKIKPGTYKFEASDMKGSWLPGDKVYVHGALGTDSQTITIAAADISADGKTVSVQLDKVTNTPLDPDGLYAMWPDECAQHSDGIMNAKTTINLCDTLITAAYLDGDTFKFVDASSAITFTVSGYDSFALCANNRVGINVTRIEVEHTSSKTKITPKKNDGYPFKYGNLKSGEKKTIWFPGNTVLKDGYTLFFCKDGKWTASYSASGDVTLSAGRPLELGNLTGKLSAYDGPEPKMPQMQKFTKYSVKFNELSGICLSADEDFLWGIDDDGRLGRISFEGQLLDSYYVGSDPEEVSLNYDTKDLLIAIEPKGVGLVKGPDYNTKYTKIFSIPGTDISDENAGMEGLTYYKNGQVFCGTQTNSHLYLCDIATGEVIWDKILYNKDQVSEIAGLFFDRLTNWLWIIDSESKKIFVFDETATNLLGTYSVSEPSNPESVCVDHKHNCVWVGDDYGSTSYLYKYEFTGLDDAIIQ